MSKQGLTADIQSSQPVEGGVDAHMQVRAAGVKGTSMKELLAKLKAWYGALQQREQRVVAGGAVALAVLTLVLGVLLPLHVGGLGRGQARRLAA